MADFVKAAVDALASHVSSNIGELEDVYTEWPNMNEELALPSISILSQPSSFAKCTPYLEEKGSVSNHQATDQYVIGQYDISLQVDIWAKYKPERASIYQKFFDLFHADLEGGMNLKLTDYFDQWCSFTQVGYRFPDGPESATRQEWRAIIDIEATCKAIVERDDYIITETPEIKEQEIGSTVTA